MGQLVRLGVSHIIEFDLSNIQNILLNNFSRGA